MRHDLHLFHPLPEIALRKAWPYWEDDEGDLLEFSADGQTFDWVTIGGIDMTPEPIGNQFTVDNIMPDITFRPACGTWAEVEALAAKVSP